MTNARHLSRFVPAELWSDIRKFDVLHPRRHQAYPDGIFFPGFIFCLRFSLMTGSAPFNIVLSPSSPFRIFSGSARRVSSMRRRMSRLWLKVAFSTLPNRGMWPRTRASTPLLKDCRHDLNLPSVFLQIGRVESSICFVRDPVLVEIGFHHSHRSRSSRLCRPSSPHRPHGPSALRLSLAIPSRSRSPSCPRVSFVAAVVSEGSSSPSHR